MTILTVGLLGVATMFSTGYTDVAAGGKMTLGIMAARQIIEDMRALPFGSIDSLNAFDTSSVATLPAANPERDVARRWRYALAGEGDGFAFTTTEKSQWTMLSADGVSLGARGRITVVDQSPGLRPNSLRLVTITVATPGRAASVQLSTLVSRP